MRMYISLTSPIIISCTVDYKVSNNVMDVYTNANPSVIIHILLQKVIRMEMGKNKDNDYFSFGNDLFC